jgi:hypothetical protein
MDALHRLGAVFAVAHEYVEALSAVVTNKIIARHDRILLEFCASDLRRATHSRNAQQPNAKVSFHAELENEERSQIHKNLTQRRQGAKIYFNFLCVSAPLR